MGRGATWREPQDRCCVWDLQECGSHSCQPRFPLIQPSARGAHRYTAPRCRRRYTPPIDRCVDLWRVSISAFLPQLIPVLGGCSWGYRDRPGAEPPLLLLTTLLLSFACMR